MDENSDYFQYVLVGYKPDQVERLPQNSIVLFNGPASVNFEHLLAGGLLIANEGEPMLSSDIPTIQIPDGSSRANC